MKHEDAIQTEAVERYLLGEMTEDEQGIFEEHYFDCPVCAADVTDGTRMMIAGKVVVEAERAERARSAANVVLMPQPQPKPPWWVPVAAAASLLLPLLGGGAGYQLAKQQLRHPPTELVTVVPLETGISRSGTLAEIPAVQPGDDLRFEVPYHDDAMRYVAAVSCLGKTESTHGISREMAIDAVSLRIGELPAGRCELVIEGVRKDGKHFPIKSSPFQVGER